MEGWIAEINEETFELVRLELDDAAFERAQDEGRRLSADEAAALALALEE